MKLTVKCAVMAALCAAQMGWGAGFLGPWTLRNPPSAIRNPTSIAYGNGQFVIVGGNGAIVTSPDGVNWTAQNSGTTKSLSAVTYGNGQFVAAGGSSILTSPDGMTWSQHDSGTTNTLYGTGYGNGQFVGVGSAGTIVTSADGMTWTARASVTTNSLYVIAYGTNRFVAAGYEGTILTSPDGITWTRSGGVGYAYLGGMVYGNGEFLLLTYTAFPLRSPDGIAWTMQNANGTGGELIAIAYGNNQFVAVGGDGESDTGGTATSSDGVTWAGHFLRGVKRLSGIAYGAGLFVAFDYTGVIYRSADGGTWISPGPTNDLFGIAYGSRQFAAVGDAGTILTSPDAVTWTQRQSGTTNALRTIAGCDSGFAVVWNTPTILTSPDGITWTPRSAGTTNAFYGVAAGGGHFAAIGQGGTIAYSPDGVEWWAGSIDPNLDLVAITFGNGEFFAIGNDRVFRLKVRVRLLSPDGSNWQLMPPDYWVADPPYFDLSWPTNSLIAAGNGRFFETTPYDAETSTNGLTWTPSPLPPRLAYPSTMTYGDGRFLAVGVWIPGCLCPYRWDVIDSPDGVKWTAEGPGTTRELTSTAYGNGRLVAVGLAGTIFDWEPAPGLDPIRLLLDGSVQGTVTGVAGTSCVVQVSTNLTDWTALTNVSTANGAAQFNDPSATNFSRRFYRAVSP